VAWLMRVRRGEGGGMGMTTLHGTPIKNHKDSIRQGGGVLHHTHNLSFSFSIYDIKVEGD
jgi:hypothetical protein